MNRGRLKSGLTGSPPPPQAARANRLSRSVRQSQQSQQTRQTRQTRTAAEPDSPRTRQPDFKTPTRIPGPRAGAGFSGESPHNDSDFQQDIIWDATSPSPNRLGKRGRKQRVGVVSISEIVSRIAPKHGRPEVAEPTLQQWIGDSATIPCTPDVQAPKPKKKSPRLNGVDDLLKLAKQFDFNMFRQDEEEVEEVEELHQQSLELLSDDILDLEDDFSASLPGNHQPPAAAAAPAAQPHQHEDDDLDFLFDGPTQRVSGSFSQATSAQPSQVKPSAASPKKASGKTPSSSCAFTAGVSTTTPKVASRNDEFEDDWANDDLLDDSLVLEMTQNPQSFMAPQLCSTQKPSAQSRPHRSPASRSVGQSAASKAERDNGSQRATFRLESDPHPSARRLQTDSWSTSKPVHGSQTQSRFLSGSQRSGQTSGPQNPQIPPKTSAGGKTGPAAPSAAHSVPQTAAASSCRQAAGDLLDDDLDSLFSCEPVWDDPADDELLCEMCEDVENQIQTAGNLPAKPPPPVGHLTNQRAALQPANHQSFTPKQTPPSATWAPGRPAGSSLAAGVGSNFTAGVRTNVDSFRLTQTKNTSGSTYRSTYVQGTNRVQLETSRVQQGTNRVQLETSRVQQGTNRVQLETSRVQQGTNRVQLETSRVQQGTNRVQLETSRVQHGSTSKDQFTFKRPNNPVSMATSKVASQCSAAEIELKKQQAMERRRQRLQAAQNLRAPT